MPLYDYQCDHCGHAAKDEFQKITAPALTECPNCGLDDGDVFHREPTLAHTDLKEFHDPIQMYSIAMDSDEEIREFQAKCPDVRVSTDPRDPMYGVPIAASRRQKLDALKTAGFVEQN